ncbi:uncharacterized protein DNG_09869 [Cephalotrichum gorgonifer]|uniref:Uncharacterized protein n=1 Tax=Cephalotrichum gorgonifer TaxID=2041049 RepID=A0AAE8N6I1_9PEZI|nr:uncharacterized protein DNG_09869 [Cephalotrichum gorgonifer]
MASEEVPTPLRVPGAGLPINARPETMFPSALASPWSGMYSWASRGVTLREQRMMAFISDITDKPEWERKVFDETIIEKWRAEAAQKPEELDGDVILSTEMFDFVGLELSVDLRIEVGKLIDEQCITELRDKAEIFKETGLVNVFDGELTIVKSDRMISESLRKSLCQGVRILEDVPDRLKDWHPRSDNMVLDLLHPSLYPVAYGLTRVVHDRKVPLDGCLEYIGKGTIVDEFKPSRSRSSGPYEWGSFQWLPTDVKLTEVGARLQGYINNLHPEKHRALYEVLEAVVGATIPVGSEDWEFPEGLLYHVPDREEGAADGWYDPAKETACAADGTPHDYSESGGSHDPDDEFLWEDDWHEWRHDNRILKQREPRSYIPQAELKNDSKRVDFREKYPEGLQVIFKLANIHLAPEKPEYKGGSWHVEGGFNEMICASAIYYYDQDNISDSHLAFRQAMDEDAIRMIPEQNEHAALEAYLGVEQDGTAIQPLGRALTCEGRVLAFPNCVQHQVQPFSLQDKGRPGHRKILAMFLVDPGRRILSTSNVPPQRRDWWAEELHRRYALSRLPPELREHAIGMVDFPVSWEKAMEMRERLMDERSDENSRITDDMMETTLSRTPLSFAAARADMPIADLLLVDSKEHGIRTPLLLADKSGDEGLGRLLLNTSKADVDSKDKHNRTPLLITEAEVLSHGETGRRG